MPIPEGTRPLLIIFAWLVVLSGVLCVVLDEQWFAFSPLVKVPLYSVVGMSVCFAFTFSLLDLVNIVSSRCSSSSAIIESQDQVYIILLTSLAMGATFGMIFGLMDVEDQRGLDLRDTLIYEEEHCIPVGVLMGGFAGLWTFLLQGQTPAHGPYKGAYAYIRNDNL